ncbi:MAG: helix-turn-helix transcriptional regulator [Nostoc sp. DedVER02]|uniref:helix-turn-helix domain-containing protein n=1 Tax=unclassified Nostoc TaxID=2593658 RepID=UPI002AD498AE|nr:MULTISPECIES: helix-turn-helix transcriptional regulator [unclassified Nostoc]MDZ7986852.1 helix-turn-helix transcriptional regulator [Nostoc sp. DedVER02]MDZ8115754.1 helix-turn-helix transcriptional regulator [Nostoc sp. DedVER01b]
MGNAVIRWKLNEVMARKRIKSKDLAELVGITEVSLYRLRKTDEMPRLTPERLNSICRFLNCQPGELLEYEPDLPDGDLTESEKQLTGK